ncbi:uncharacterized protein LOC144477951 isoform X3 [Augochlora pura]
MDDLDDHHYTVIRVLLSFVGLWPYDRTWFAFARRMIYILLISSAFVFQVKALFYYENLNRNIVIDAVSNLSLTSIILIKHLAFLWRIKYIKHLLETVRKDWRDINDEYETKILLKKADDGKLLTMLLSVIVYVTIMTYVIYMTSIVGSFTYSNTDEDDYIMNSRIKLAYTKDEEKYSSISLLHTYVCVVMGLSAVSGTEGITIMCCFHGLAVYEILSHRVINAFNDDKMNDISLKKDKRMKEELVGIGILHEHLLRFCSVLQKAIMSAYFILLSLAIATLSLNLLRFSYIIVRSRKMSRLLSSAAVVIGHYFYLGMANNLGQMGIDSSANFFLHTFGCYAFVTQVYRPMVQSVYSSTKMFVVHYATQYERMYFFDRWSLLSVSRRIY